MAGVFEFDQLAAPPPPAPPPTQSELEQATAAAHAHGFEQGRAAAEAETMARLAPLEQVLRSTAEELANERDQAAERVERPAVELALRIAEQALGAALAIEPERVVDAVRGAMRRLVERERVTVLVNPGDLELVRDAITRLLSELGGVEHCEVQAERRVPRGGAVVRTAEGEVDATLQSKLDRAREVLEDELAAGRDGR
jgi:flagellar assembly protein FliH